MSKSDDTRNLSREEMERETARLRLEMTQLELEDLRMRVENEKTRREQIAMAHKRQQQSLEDSNARIQAAREACNHRKGGKNLEGIGKGHDSYFSISKITYPWGETTVMCLRCTKEWRKPPESLKKTDPAAYKKQMDEYKWAMELPTDNEPTGSQIFLIVDNRSPEQKRASGA